MNKSSFSRDVINHMQANEGISERPAPRNGTDCHGLFFYTHEKPAKPVQGGGLYDLFHQGASDYPPDIEYSICWWVEPDGIEVIQSHSLLPVVSKCKEAKIKTDMEIWIGSCYSGTCLRAPLCQVLGGQCNERQSSLEILLVFWYSRCFDCKWRFRPSSWVAFHWARDT